MTLTKAMSTTELLSDLKSIEGWLADEEAVFLFESARRADPSGVIVEIGSWQGKSTVCLAQGSKQGSNSPVYAIDPHTGSRENQEAAADQKVWTLEAFKLNIQRAGVCNLVIPLVMTSEAANRGWEKPVSMLWIDGAHEYEFVRKDFELWYPFLIDGGTIAFHDSSQPGVKRVLRESVYTNSSISDFKLASSIFAGRKRVTSSYSEKLDKTFKVALREVYDFGAVHSLKSYVPKSAIKLIKSLGR